MSSAGSASAGMVTWFRVEGLGVGVAWKGLGIRVQGLLCGVAWKGLEFGVADHVKGTEPREEVFRVDRHRSSRRAHRLAQREPARVPKGVREGPHILLAARVHVAVVRAVGARDRDTRRPRRRVVDWHTPLGRHSLGVEDSAARLHDERSVVLRPAETGHAASALVASYQPSWIA